MIHFLFSASPIEPNEPDSPFAAQQAALEQAGFSWSVVSDDHIAGTRSLRGIAVGSSVVYRGWMLKPNEYCRLSSCIASTGAKMFTSADDYLATHYLPSWYSLIRELTPETVVLAPDAEIEPEFRKLGWNAYFLKDYVKSLKTGPGAIARTPQEAEAIVKAMRDFRGEIEGGLCLRRVEDFLPETETRLFVLNGETRHPRGESVPEIVQVCASRVARPFFSIDLIRRRDGVLRIVEVGDGQVSDLVGWTPETFADVWFQFSQTNSKAR